MSDLEFIDITHHVKRLRACLSEPVAMLLNSRMGWRMRSRHSALFMCATLFFFVGCGSGPSVGSLESAAETQLEALESKPERAVNWAITEADFDFFAGEPWTRTKCMIDEGTLEYEVLESKKPNTPIRGVVTFMLTIEQSGYCANEEEASTAELTKTQTTDCRFEYWYVDEKWEFKQAHWYVKAGHTSKINSFILQFFGVEQ